MKLVTNGIDKHDQGYNRDDIDHQFPISRPERFRLHICIIQDMQATLYVLGRQPALGLAELESLYGAEAVRACGAGCAYVTTDKPVDFARLGGSMKQAVVLSELGSTNWKIVEKELTGLMRSSAFTLPTSGKFHLGLSAIGPKVTPAKLNALGLTLKKVIRSRHDGSVRLVPNKSLELSTAQVYHSHLADEHGAELLIVSDGTKTLIARTVAVQDIDSYTLRDRGRPKRDARVGMLPPKLAQIIINLATGQQASRSSAKAKLQTSSSGAFSSLEHAGSGTEVQRESTAEKKCARAEEASGVASSAGQQASHSEVLLDPFCGTGVTLQEALLMGYSVYGTDLEPRMIAYSQDNIDWLTEGRKISAEQSCALEVGDATTFTWQEPVDIVAGEAYLGLPFTKMPDHRTLEQNVSDVNTILKKFLTNIYAQLKSGARLCLAVPAWQTKPHTFRHLPLLDSLEEIGYNRVEFERVRTKDLIYYRDDQIVARQLLVLTSK